ncbi:Uncharacterised protein [Enterobacter cloacae]|nr:Uncharacterised protein [Enterobacter cloacae]VAU69052.1 Uncharacterised protein [Klebsiella pneumoniae]
MLAIAHNGTIAAGPWVTETRSIGENFYLFTHLW